LNFLNSTNPSAESIKLNVKPIIRMPKIIFVIMPHIRI